MTKPSSYEMCIRGWVKCAVAENPSAPASVLETLARDSDAWVRRAVAGNPSTAPTVLVKLSRDQDSPVKETAISNPNTPLPALIKQVSSKAVGVREALASQSHRSTEILHSLWKDTHDSVRQAVAACPDLTQAQLDEMLHDCELETDLATLLVHPNLGVKGVECIFDKLFTTPAADSAWYRRQLAEASPEIRAAAQADQVTFYHGKDPNKAVLAKRALAPLMALCAGPFIEPTRLVKVVGSTDWVVRAAVARNPGTPPNLIKKLIADAHPLVAALAKRSLVPIPEVSKTSDNQDGEALDLARAVAEVINRIRQVAGDKPMTLVGLVSDGAWGDQADVVDVLNALSVIVRFDRFLPKVCSKLGQEHLALMCEMGAKSPNPKVRLALAEIPQCPVSVITRLAEDDNLDVVLAALKNPVVPPENRAPIIQGLLKRRGTKLLEVAWNSNSPPDLLEALSKSRNEVIRRCVAGNRSTTESVLMALSKDADPSVRTGVAQNPTTPVPLLEELSKEPNLEVKQNVAANRSTPASVKVRVLEALSKSARADFRVSVAENPFTPLPVLEALSKDHEISVRREVARNPSTPVSLLEIFAEDSDISIRQSVAANRSTPGSALEALSKNSEWKIREIVAGNPSTPPSVLEALSMLDPVRIETFYSLPGVVRKELSVPDSSIQRAVAANPSTPLTVLDTLSWDSDGQVRLAVARNPSTSEAILSCLAQDSVLQIAVAAAFNPSAPSEARERYIEGWINRMESAVLREACNRADKPPVPQTPISTEDLLRALGWLGYFTPGDDNKALTKASRSKDWLVRLGAALHPDATEGILKLLRQDADPSVARAANSRQPATRNRTLQNQ